MESKLKKAIKESGRNLHLEVAELLSSSGWETDLSVYYCDDITDRPREVDILAKKKISVYQGKCPDKYKFEVFLCIECKYFRDEFAFRLWPNNRDDSKEAILVSTKNVREMSKENLEDIGLGGHHYLIPDKLSKLFDASNRNQDRDIFDAITSSIKSLIFFQNKTVGTSIFYPVVIYDGIPGFYLVEKSKNNDKDLDNMKLGKDILFGLRYSYPHQIFGVPGTRNETKSFRVFFLHKDEINKYLGTVEKEVEIIRSHLLKFYNRIERGII